MTPDLLAGIGELPPPEHRFDGATINVELDCARLTRQMRRVWAVLTAHEGHWLTAAHIGEEANCPETSAGSRCRDFRKSKFGRKNVQSKRRPGHQGVWVYALFPGTYKEAA
jgi:hypothetical protein